MEKLHHANVLIGEDCRGLVFEILEKDLSFRVKANPDFLLIESQSLGIDDARNLERWAIGKPLSGETKASLIIAKSITHEAQNALLKVLEEPPLGTYIFINLESLGGLLPTFISRVRILNLLKKKVPDDEKSQNDAHKFFHSKIKEKLSLIRSLSKDENKTRMKELIKNLEEIAYKNGSENMKNILTAKIFASARGSSPKMLLEWLSCVL
jgi:DNA polymerase III delta prime subunit